MPPRPTLSRIWKKFCLRAGLAADVACGFDSDLDRCTTKVSYSQCGEDLIAWFLLRQMEIHRPYYLDVGAHHPTRLNNTALFHAMGACGINIEPDPSLFAAFPPARPADLNLNIGVGENEEVLTFFRMADPSLNTFSAEEAARIEKERFIPIIERLPIPTAPLSVIIRDARQPVDFVSIDVEGRDLAVLSTLDLDACRPAVLCVETVDFVSGRKNPGVAGWLTARDYGVYADTRINTLFVDLKRFPLP